MAEALLSLEEFEKLLEEDQNKAKEYLLLITQRLDNETLKQLYYKVREVEGLDQ